MALPNEPLPTYFQPLAAREAPSAGRPQIPATVLDMFTLRDPRSGQTERIVVIGCLGGGLLVATGEAINSLEPEIRSQIQSAEVSARSQFRTIVAADLLIATLDAVEQQVQASGLNDAVSLYGVLYARLTFAGGRLQVQPGADSGQFIAGRIDLLNGCRLGVQYAFHSPQAEGGQIGHVVLPAAPLEAIRQGQGLALLYPFFDPLKVQSADNTFILLRIIYDLLTRLQADVREKDARHPFAQAMIYVPSRRQIEQDLEADGYQIEGDTAFRRRASPAGGSPSLLNRLRSLAEEWTAPRIALPPQATLDDYQRLIDSLLPDLSSATDTAMAQAIATCFAPPTTITQVPPFSSAGVPTTPLTPAMTRAAPAVRQVAPQRDWSADFAAATANMPARNTSAWWLAPQTAGAESAGRDLVSRDDWLRDFLAGGSVPGNNSTAPQDAQPRPQTWDDDFADAAPKPKASGSPDWLRDFEPDA